MGYKGPCSVGVQVNLDQLEFFKAHLNLNTLAVS